MALTRSQAAVKAASVRASDKGAVRGCAKTWAWTGDAALVQRAAFALRLYAIGYALLAVGAFPYYLQYAKGNLRLHLIGNALFVLLLIPSVIWAATHHGMTGAGWAWLIANAVYFFCWTPLVHRHFAPGVHAGWLLKDVLRPASLAVLVAAIGWSAMDWAGTRGVLGLQLFVIGGVLLLLAYMLSDRLKFRQN